jgi:ATP-binding cassette, subfamily B, bacterial
MSPHLKLLRAYLAPQRARIGLLGLLLLAELGLQLALPRVVQTFIDSALAGVLLPTLLTLGGAYLAVAIGKNGIGVARHYAAQNIGLIATNHIRVDLTAHCLRLDTAFHNARTPGEMIERIDGDVGKLAHFLSGFLVQIALNGLLLLGAMVALIGIDLRVAVPIALALMFAVWATRVINPRLAEHSKRELEASARLFGFVEERLSGTEDIRANGAVAHVLNRHVWHVRNHVGAAFRAAAMGSLSWRTMQSAMDVGATLSLLAAGLLFLDGTLTLGSVIAVLAYTQLMSDPIEQLIRELGRLQEATAAVGRVQQLFDTQPTLRAPERNAAKLLPVGPLPVAFDRVTFAYPDDDPVLRDVSFGVAAGSTLGVIGRTGSGKTTLTRLLLRLYDPQQGGVSLGGVDVRMIDNTDLRARTAIVTQDIQLFGASLRDNLTMFDPAVPDDRLWEALTAVGLVDWARALPEGLDTVLATGGSGLSAGESQLLAFARVFLRNPGLVILDEASSRLDPVTERKLDHAVDRLMDGRTGVLIAHRLSTLNRVDLILVMAEGRVVEFGRRETLAADPTSHYAGLLCTGIDEALT